MNPTDKRAIDPFGKLLGLRQMAHPWHGVSLGAKAPHEVISFIEMVDTDTVKYEVDKNTGYLIIDRPQKYSNILPALYGFLPQTYCGDLVGGKSAEILKRENIVGDGDPLDVCILTEKNISHGNILVNSIPIGGFRMIDGNEADDKIIAVLKGDAVYGNYKDIADAPKSVIERLRHYFLTYKDMPGVKNTKCEITHIYNAAEAKDVIERATKDYQKFVERLLFQ